MKFKLVDGKPVNFNVDKLIDFLSNFQSNKVRFVRSGKFIFIEDPSKEDYDEDDDESGNETTEEL